MYSIIRFVSISTFFIYIFSATGFACCDESASEFNATTGHWNFSVTSNAIVVDAEVKDLRFVKPLHRPREMDIEILTVLQGMPPGKLMTLKTGERSSSLTFEKFKIGKRYRMVFFNSGTAAEPEYSMSLCGKSSEEIP